VAVSVIDEKNREKRIPPPRLSKSRATLSGGFGGPLFSGVFKNIELHFNLLIGLTRFGSGRRSRPAQRGRCVSKL